MNILIKLTLRALIAFICISLLSACDKAEEAASFDMLFDVPERQVIADSAQYESTDGDVLLLEQTIHINIDSLSQKFEIKRIESAKFDFIRLRVDTPEGSNFNWITNLKATVAGEGLAEIEVGTYDGTKQDAEIIDITLNNAPITPYLVQETFVLKIYAGINPPLPASTTSLIVNSRIRVTIQPV